MKITDRLDIDAIEAGLKTKSIGKKILVYKSTLSTNDVAWEYSGNRTNNGLAVFAEHQEAGRGRLGNKWLSQNGQSVLCSILLLDRKCSAELLTITAAVAAAQATSTYSKQNARIKWPNDIMINGRKVAGILLESRNRNGKNDYVIGIGINCHQQPDFFKGADLQQPATSIDIEADTITDRNSLARELLTQIDRRLIIAEENSEQIINQWRQFSSQIGHFVTLRYNQRQFSGNCIGVDPAKGLILQLSSGGVRMFDAAHTTIVKQVVSKS